MSFTNLSWLSGPLLVSVLSVCATFACSAGDDSGSASGTGANVGAGAFPGSGGDTTGAGASFSSGGMGQVGSGGSLGATGGAVGSGGGTSISGPVTMGYILDMDEWGGTAAFDSLNFASTDFVIHAFYTGNASTGLLEPVNSTVTQYRDGGLVTKVHAAGKRIVMSLGGANHSGSLKTIAASATLRETFVSDVVAKINQWGYDGIDLDLEFPVGGAEPQQHLDLMTALYNAIKANNAEHIAMFGISPGYYIDQFLWSQLGAVSDYGFYFCYDWSNPANGPMTNPGQNFTAFGGAQFEASCRGAMNYMLGQGYPASKLVVGLPFYANGGAHYSTIAPSVDAAIPDANYMEASDGGGGWWPNPASMEMKMDAVLDPSKSVLTGGAVAAGVGWWEWGYENPAAPKLSTAIRTKLGK